MDPSNDMSSGKFLQMEPDQVLGKMNTLLSKTGGISESDGHALAEGAGSKAMTAARAGNKDDDYKWAEIAVRIYDHLAMQNSSNKSERFLNSAMNLRSEMIGRKGEKKGDILLDTERLKDWFISRLKMDPAEARVRALKWKTLPPGEILELRTIKNRLKTIKSALTKSSLSNDQALSAWRELEKILP